MVISVGGKQLLIQVQEVTLLKIITRMKELAKTLPEYETVRADGRRWRCLGS